MTATTGVALLSLVKESAPQMRRVLLMVEWSVGCDDPPGKLCPRCGAGRESGHFPGCELGAVLEPIR